MHLQLADVQHARSILQGPSNTLQGPSARMEAVCGECPPRDRLDEGRYRGGRTSTRDDMTRDDIWARGDGRGETDDATTASACFHPRQSRVLSKRTRLIRGATKRGHSHRRNTRYYRVRIVGFVILQRKRDKGGRRDWGQSGDLYDSVMKGGC